MNYSMADPKIGSKALGVPEKKWSSVLEACGSLPSNGFSAAVSILDISDSAVQINIADAGNAFKPFRAASVIKTALLACLFYQAQCGLLNLEDEVFVVPEDIVGGGVFSELTFPRTFSWLEISRLMMIVSDNSCANKVLSFLSREKANYFMRSVLKMESSAVNRFFMHSPEIEGENFTSSADCVKMLAELWHPGILDGQYFKEFWSIMAGQMFIEKLPYFLPEHVMHYNKTGELDDGVRNDIAVFKCRDFAWCAAFLTDQKEIPAYEADRIIAEFSLKLYRVLAESYNF